MSSPATPTNVNEHAREHERISPDFIESVCARLANDKPVKRKLPGGGRLNIDRLLPFLCIYRRDPRRSDNGTDLFVHAEAAYINAPGIAPVRQGLTTLVQRIAGTAAARLGGFLIVEIWSGLDTAMLPPDGETAEMQLPAPAFRILTRAAHRPEKTCDTLARELQRVKVHRRKAESTFVLDSGDHPPHMSPLIAPADAEAMNCHVVGLEIRPVYRDLETGEPYPDVLRALRRGVGRALKKAFFTYSLNRTSLRPQHYFALGRKSLPKLVWEVDQQLADVSSHFNFLLQVTPINAERSWREFSESGFVVGPELEYRPLDADPLLLKRKLLQIPTEQVEDPTLSHLLRQTQDELDRQITMLADIRTPCFLPGSLQVFGAVEPELLALAERILKLPAAATAGGAQLSAAQFLERAEEEIRYYQSQFTGFAAQAMIRQDIYSGLLCAGGNLLIGREMSIPDRRACALLQHEVGTHLVTYYNGAQQPLRLLRVGLAGYDGLQEGLAVLSEYLVGGLTLPRLRLLAARVAAVHNMAAGSPFPKTFQRLREEFGFEARQAYTITLRVYRGGGLTKDAVYLRGLTEILRYVQSGGKLQPLLMGKIAVEHIPIIKELQLRDVLQPAPLTPRYLTDAAALERLEQLRGSDISVLDLVSRPTAENGVAP